MPVTRSSSRSTSQQLSSRPYSSPRIDSSGNGGTKKTSNPPSNEIIVLSSDDDEPPSKGTLSSKGSKTSIRLRKKVAKSAAPSVLADVLEISSDDEGKPNNPSMKRLAQPSEATNKDLQCTIEKLQRDLEQSKKLLASTSREVEELKRDCANKDVLSGLEEHTICEVCTLTMWCPYILPECGHSFCEDCLVDWFSTTQAQHFTANPLLDGNRAVLAGQLHRFVQMVPNLHMYGPHGQHHVRVVLAELRRHRPEYTCPSCRKEVLNKPVEDFRLKGFIRQFAGMMGEANPDKDTSQYQGTSPFDDFFAAPISAR